MVAHWQAHALRQDLEADLLAQVIRGHGVRAAEPRARVAPVDEAIDIRPGNGDQDQGIDRVPGSAPHREDVEDKVARTAECFG